MTGSIYLFAVLANLFFAIGSQIYTHFTIKFSASWMNLIKALVALIAFGITITAMGGWHNISVSYFALLFVSGAIGLGIGDIFLLKAFKEMGPGRTLILFGFQPLILGSFGYFLFNQEVDSAKFLAIIFFILCLGTFSLESFKKSGHWQMAGILMAGLGMLLDACGVVITRYVFDHTEILPLEGNFYRCIGAVSVYLIIGQFSPINMGSRFKSLVPKEKAIVIVGSLFGTYLSLMFYLMALEKAHLASLSGIAITGTIFSNALECILAKKAPSKYLIISFCFFLLGMKILIF